MQGGCSKGVREEVAFAEEAGSIWNIGEIVEVDCGGGEIIFGLEEVVCEGEGKGVELGAWEGN